MSIVVLVMGIMAIIFKKKLRERLLLLGCCFSFFVGCTVWCIVFLSIYDTRSNFRRSYTNCRQISKILGQSACGLPRVPKYFIIFEVSIIYEHMQMVSINQTGYFWIISVRCMDITSMNVKRKYCYVGHSCTFKSKG